MKILKRVSLVVLGMWLLINNGLAQQIDKNSTDYKSPDEQQRINMERQRDALDRQDKNFEFAKSVKLGRDLVSPSLTREQKNIKKDARKYAELLDKMLAAPPQYQTAFADLLKDKKMYLVRIYPDQKCNLLNEKTISSQEAERCDGIIPYAGGGSFYSFKEKTNVYFTSSGADIHFIDGKFIVDLKRFGKGIISEIGDVDLENISLNSASVKFLIESEPKKTLVEAKEENKLLEKGINSNGFNYSSAAFIKLNSTYVMRSIAYKTKERIVFKNTRPGQEVTDISGTSKDELIAFKVVGQEKDGSIIILWKKLK